MRPSPPVAHHRAKYAALKRRRADDDPEVLAEGSALRAQVLAEHIERVVDGMPPLTDAQRAELAELLRPVRVPGGMSGGDLE